MNALEFFSVLAILFAMFAIQYAITKHGDKKEHVEKSQRNRSYVPIECRDFDVEDITDCDVRRQKIDYL